MNPIRADFTLFAYRELLKTLINHGYLFDTFNQYATKTIYNRSNKTVDNNIDEYNRLIVLRHDVDALPENSLNFARIQSSFGIVGTYYFRIIPKIFDANIITAIASLGHEIGYHYETMDTCNGDIDKAYTEFCRNLEKIRKIAPVNTISMHGSPLSKFDNRAIWKKYDYKNLGISAEPYFDINFNEMFYLTDTGRRWDGHLYNIRDKATEENPVTNIDFLKLNYHSTWDITTSIDKQSFPLKAMLNFHPQRWHNKMAPWIRELFWQNFKNQGKRILLHIRR